MLASGTDTLDLPCSLHSICGWAAWRKLTSKSPQNARDLRMCCCYLAVFYFETIFDTLNLWATFWPGIHIWPTFVLNQVFSGSFWMGAFNGATAKRHRLWSNCKELLKEVVRRGEHTWICLSNCSAWVHIFFLHLLFLCHLATEVSGGHLSREALRSLPGSADGLVRKYIDKKGRRRHAGIAAKLESSQCLGCDRFLLVHPVLNLKLIFSSWCV